VIPHAVARPRTKLQIALLPLVRPPVPASYGYPVALLAMITERSSTSAPGTTDFIVVLLPTAAGAPSEPMREASLSGRYRCGVDLGAWIKPGSRPT
jgi:hypothetical protein